MESLISNQKNSNRSLKLSTFNISISERYNDSWDKVFQGQKEKFIDFAEYFQTTKGRQAFKIFDAQNQGLIFLLEDGEIVQSFDNSFCIKNYYDEIPCKLNLDYRYIPGEAEYLLFRVINETIPNHLIWDYLPTLLIFLDLTGLFTTRLNYPVLGDPWDINRYCLGSGVRLNAIGLFDGTEKEKSGKPRNDHYYTEFIRERADANQAGDPGILLYKCILDFVEQSYDIKASKVMLPLLDKLVNAFHLYFTASMAKRYTKQKKLSPEVNAYTPENLWAPFKNSFNKLLPTLIEAEAICLKDSASKEIKSVTDLHFDVSKIYSVLLRNNEKYNIEKFWIQLYLIRNLAYKTISKSSELLKLLNEIAMNSAQII